MPTNFKLYRAAGRALRVAALLVLGLGSAPSCTDEATSSAVLNAVGSTDANPADIAQMPDAADQLAPAEDQETGADTGNGGTSNPSDALGDSVAPTADVTEVSVILDQDGDGLDDATELGLGTDPGKSDTDGDGLSDGDEVKAGLSPKDPDTDNDGLDDGDELAAKTDPKKSDTDGDGLADGEEVNKFKSNPSATDTDKDGLSDSIEVGQAGDADPATKTDLVNPDSDGDGVLDGAEDKNKNGKVDAGEADPNNGADGGQAPVADPCATKICNDNIACTIDSCDPTKGCIAVPNSKACADGNVCTAENCDPTKGCIAVPTSKPCDDGNACTADSCDPIKGCIAVPNSKPCDDGNSCTTDTCDPITGCVALPNTKACEDGNACTTDSCDPIKGCIAVPNGKPCDDGNPCTAGDACVAAACQPGTDKCLACNAYHSFKVGQADLAMRSYPVTLAEYTSCAQAGSCDSNPLAPSFADSKQPVDPFGGKDCLTVSCTCPGGASKCECPSGLVSTPAPALPEPVRLVPPTAAKFCKHLGGRLPTLAELEAAQGYQGGYAPVNAASCKKIPGKYAGFNPGYFVAECTQGFAPWVAGVSLSDWGKATTVCSTGKGCSTTWCPPFYFYGKELTDVMNFTVSSPLYLPAAKLVSDAKAGWYPSGGLAYCVFDGKPTCK